MMRICQSLQVDHPIRILPKKRSVRLQVFYKILSKGRPRDKVSETNFTLLFFLDKNNDIKPCNEEKVGAKTPWPSKKAAGLRREHNVT